MENKVYSFSTNDAIEHGVDSAIILHNIRYWLDHARANEQMINDGYHWMFMTAAKMQSIMPFWSANKIQKMLKTLSSKGVLIVGEYNKSSWNRTNWYTMPEFKHSANKSNASSQKDYSTSSQTADSHYDQNKDSNNGSTSPEKVDYKKVQDIFNHHFCRAIDPTTKETLYSAEVKMITPKRKKLIDSFFNQTKLDMEKFEYYIEHVSSNSSWLYFRKVNVKNGITYKQRPFEFYMTLDNYVKASEENENS